MKCAGRDLGPMIVRDVDATVVVVRNEIALGFRNLGHCILRSLIHSGQLQARINAL